MTVPPIMKRIEALGVRMHSYKNPLAVMHTTLNRMHLTGQVEKAGGGKVANGGFQKASFR